MNRLDGQVERTHIYHRVKWPLGSKHDCHIYEYHRPKCQPVGAESCEGRRFHLKGLPASFQKTSRTSVLIKVRLCSKYVFIG